MSEPVETTETVQAGQAPEGVQEPQTPEGEPDTFAREYVEQLRAEAAERRTEAKTASERGDALYERLLTSTIEQATADILHDPSDLPRDGDYEDGEGFIDAAKIRAAAEDLAARKPYLSRPRGDIKQSAREEPARQMSLAALARGER